MKKALLAATVLVSCVSSLEAFSNETQPDDDSHCEVSQLRPRGSDRIKKVTFCDGYTIPLIADRGESLPIEMPPGWTVRTIMPSEQDVMDSRQRVAADTSPREAERGDSPMRQNAEAEAAAQRGDNGCKKNANIIYCVRRERFIYLMPITHLKSQTLPVIMVETKAGKEIEYNVVFDLSTDSTKQYFSLRVFPPLPAVARSRPAAPNPARVGSPRNQPPPIAGRSLGCPPSGCLHNTQPQNLVAPSKANSAYEIQGDRSLIGGGR